jgi:hypothetical protein
MPALGHNGTEAQADQGDFLASWREAMVNPAMPSIARVYDYWFGSAVRTCLSVVVVFPHSRVRERLEAS